MSDINEGDPVTILKSGEYRGATGIVTKIESDEARVNLDADTKKTVKVKVAKLVRRQTPAPASAAAAAVAAATATAATGNEAPTAAPAPPAAPAVPAAAAAAATPATAVATTTTTPISNIESFVFTPSQVNDKLFDFPSSPDRAVREAQDMFDGFNNQDLKIYISENGGTVGKKNLFQKKNTAIELCLHGKMPSCQKCQQSKCKEFFKDESMAEGIVKCNDLSCNHAINSNNVQREAALTLDACKVKLAQEKKEREEKREARVMAVEVPEEALNTIAERTETHGRRGSVEAWADFMKTPQMRERIDCNDSQLHIGSELSHFFTKNTSDDGITNHENIFRDVLRQWLPRDAAETRTEVLEENADLKEALEAFIERAKEANAAKKGTITNPVINRFINTLVLVTKSKVVVKNTDPADLLKDGFKRVSIDEIRNWKEKNTFNAKWDEKMKTAEASAAAASAAANAGQAPPTV
jgi:ribosomal protein L24